MTYGDKRLTPNECMAAKYLHADGYTTADIALALGTTGATVGKHVRGDCECPDLEAPLPVERITGDGLQTRRKAADLTQQELADRLDVSRSAVAKWERGDAKPRPDRALRLHDVLSDE